MLCPHHAVNIAHDCRDPSDDKALLDSRGGFQILVKLLHGKTIPISCSSTNTIGEVKLIILDKEGIPQDHQILIFGRSQLEDGRTLSDYDVKCGSILFLVVRLSVAVKDRTSGKVHLQLRQERLNKKSVARPA